MEDVWSHIAKFIPRRSWKDFIFTCKLFASFNTLYEVRERANHLKTLLLKYPDEKWDFATLAKNERLSISFLIRFGITKECNIFAFRKDWDFSIVLKHPNLPWDMDFIKKNGSCKDILKYPEVDWDYKFISRTYNFKPDYEVIALLKDKPWNWKCLSVRLKDINVLLKYPDLPWEWDHLCNLGTKANKEKYPHLPWCERTFIDLVFHENRAWSYPSKTVHTLSSYEYLNPEVILKYPNLPWVWDTLSSNKAVPIKWICEHSFLPWDWKLVSKREDLTINLVKEYDVTWNWPPGIQK